MKKLLLFLLAFGFTYAQAQEHHMAPKHNSHHHHRSRHRQHSMSHHRSAYSRHNIKVNNDAMDNPYHGKNSRQNDGAKKNDHRNMNYNTGQPLPPSDGSK